MSDVLELELAPVGLKPSQKTRGKDEVEKLLDEWDKGNRKPLNLCKGEEIMSDPVIVGDANKPNPFDDPPAPPANGNQQASTPQLPSAPGAEVMKILTPLIEAALAPYVDAMETLRQANTELRGKVDQQKLIQVSLDDQIADLRLKNAGLTQKVASLTLDVDTLRPLLAAHIRRLFGNA